MVERMAFAPVGCCELGDVLCCPECRSGSVNFSGGRWPMSGRHAALRVPRASSIVPVRGRSSTRADMPWPWMTGCT